MVLGLSATRIPRYNDGAIQTRQQCTGGTVKFNLQIWQILLLPALTALLLALPAGAQTPEPLTTIFGDAAAEFSVPRDLLGALGYTRSHLRSQVSELNEFGVMQLPPQQVAAAAALLGAPVDAVRFDTRQNVRGAAALLRQTADRLYPAQSALSTEQWFVVTAAFSFPGNPTQGREHARQVFGVLADGLTAQAGGETVTIAPWPEARPLAAQPIVRIASDDYAPAHWVAAHDSNFSAASRTADDIDMIVIHTTEANYSAVLDHFTRPERWASAHYVIRSADGDVSQMVRDSDVAWHAGHWQTNLRSIGIEHEAFVDDASWYTDEMYRASVKLVRHLAQKYAIPLDRQHIIGHVDVPGCPFTGGGASCHTDPGPHWDWDYFFRLLQAETPTPTP
ncbi:MAG: N-acetylmuramoyl-L-alanine amidase, partial [Chloroflexi bacterium]